MIECNVCTEVRALYGSTESIAPWLCECFVPEPKQEKFYSQHTVYGCACRIRRLKLTGRPIVDCRCK